MTFIEYSAAFIFRWTYTFVYFHFFQPTPNPPTPKPTPPPVDYYALVKEQFDPVFFDRGTGWDGQTYISAVQFCRSKSRVLCPETAVCPHQPGAEDLPIGGAKDGVAWVPLDSDNVWVQVGQENSCALYADLYQHPEPAWGLTGEDNESITRHIVCCRDESAPVPMDSSVPVQPSTETYHKWDNLAIEIYRPQWHTSDDGYTPSTHFNAQLHCKKTGKVLCPTMAYCPTGASNVEGGRSPLLLGLERFPGDVWAPVGKNLDFLQIGTYLDDETSTCKPVTSMNRGKLPSNLPKLGDFILCCEGGEEDPMRPCGDGHVNNGVCSDTEKCCSKNGFCAKCDRVSLLDADGDEGLSDVNSGQNNDLPTAVVEAGQKYAPLWLGRDEGWTGGSYDDAENFCTKLKAQLCPFDAYCPLGGSEPIMPGVPNGFDTNDEHYSPVADVPNAWVNVGKKNGDSATTCRGYDELTPNKPEWGLSSAHPEMKRYVLCCRGSSR